MGDLFALFNLFNSTPRLNMERGMEVPDREEMSISVFGMFKGLVVSLSLNSISPTFLTLSVVVFLSM